MSELAATQIPKPSDEQAFEAMQRRTVALRSEGSKTLKLTVAVANVNAVSTFSAAETVDLNNQWVFNAN